MLKFRRSSLVKIRSGNQIVDARIVDFDSDPRCHVMVVDLRNVDMSIMVPRSDIVEVTDY